MLKAVSASKPRNKPVHNHAVETLSVSLHPVPAVTNIPFCCQTLRSFSPSPSTTEQTPGSAWRAVSSLSSSPCRAGSSSSQQGQELPHDGWREGKGPGHKHRADPSRDLRDKRVGQVQGPACQSCSLLLLPGQLGWAAGTAQDLLEHSAIRLQARCGSRRVFHPRISGRWSFSTAWHPFTAHTLHGCWHHPPSSHPSLRGSLAPAPATPASYSHSALG